MISFTTQVKTVILKKIPKLPANGREDRALARADDSFLESCAILTGFRIWQRDRKGKDQSAAAEKTKKLSLSKTAGWSKNVVIMPRSLGKDGLLALWRVCWQGSCAVGGLEVFGRIFDLPDVVR